MPKKPIYVRIEEDARKDFDEVLELTGLGETQFVKAAIKALVEYVRKHGEIRLPLAIIPKSKTTPRFTEAGEEKADANAGGFSTPSMPRSPVRYSASVNERPSAPRSSKKSAPGSKP